MNYIIYTKHYYTFVLLGNKVQTDPPTVPVSSLFKDHVYPIGEIHEYPLDEYVNSYSYLKIE